MKKCLQDIKLYLIIKPRVAHQFCGISINLMTVSVDGDKHIRLIYICARFSKRMRPCISGIQTTCGQLIGSHRV